MKDRVNRALDALFPAACLYCGLRCPGALPLCAPCRRELIPNEPACRRCALPLATPGAGLCGGCLQRPPPFSRTLAPWVYDAQLALLVGEWKFRRQQRLTPLLADLWLQRQRPPPVDLLVPVPLHWRRLWRRGFNQATLFAEALRRGAPELAGTALLTRGLQRRRPTASQASLSAGERRRNLRGAFTAPAACANLRTAIVDDVMTTGATAAALASALLDAGAAEVQLWCLARTPAPPR
jgi:ComF family protein